MRDKRLRKAAFAIAVFACALSTLGPAQAAEAKVTGTIRLAWFGSSGEDLNALPGLGNGAFGYGFDVLPTWQGKQFRILCAGCGENDVLLNVQGFKVYPVDLNVYFHSDQGWDHDGTKVYWDNETGVNQGPEPPQPGPGYQCQGYCVGTPARPAIPPTTNRAFVVISNVRTPWAHDIDFEFFVTL